ncbi:MAG: hypothetical protein RLZZ58_2308 [Pseudomonadota bacterium]
MNKALTLAATASAMVLASCATGPRPGLAMPQIRSTPVLASMSSTDLLAHGKSYLRMKQYGLAIEMLRGAARDPAQTAEAYNGLGVAYDGIGRRDLAETYFERAIAAAPGDDRFQANLGRFYAASDQPEKQRRLLADMDAERLKADLIAAAPTLPVNDSAAPNMLAGAAAADVALVTADAAPVTAVPASMSFAVKLAPESPLAAALAPVIAESSISDFAAIEFGGAKCTIGNATNADGPCLWQANDSLTAGAIASQDRMMVRTSLGEVFLITGDAVPAYGVARNDPLPAKSSLAGRSMLGMVAAMLEVQNKAALASKARTVSTGRPRTIRVTLVGKGPPS